MEAATTEREEESLANQMLTLVCQVVQGWVNEHFPETQAGDKLVSVVAEPEDSSLPVLHNLHVSQEHIVERLYDQLPLDQQRSCHEGIRDTVWNMLDSLKTVEKQATRTSHAYVFADQSAVTMNNVSFQPQGNLMPMIQAISWRQPVLRVGDEQMPTSFNLHRLGYQLNAFARDTSVYKHIDTDMPLLAHSQTPGDEHLTVFKAGQPPIVITIPRVGQERGQLVDLNNPGVTDAPEVVEKPALPHRNPNEQIETRYPASLLNQVARQFDLQLTGDNAKRLLNGQKTDVVITGDGSTGKLYVLNTPDTDPQLVLQDVRRELTLKDSYLGHVFTDKDKQNLLKYGDMGRAVDLIDKQSALKFTGFVGVDKETKTLTVLRADQIRPKIERMSHLKGIPLNGLQKQRLMEGKAIRLDNMTSKAGTLFSAYVRVSAAGRNLRFDHIPAGQSLKNGTALLTHKEEVKATNETNPPKPQRARRTPKPKS